MNASKQMVFVFVCVLAACVSAGPAGAADPPKGPRIEIRQESVDLGKVVEGTVVRQVFEISSAGDQALEITKVETS